MNKQQKDIFRLALRTLGNSTYCRKSVRDGFMVIAGIHRAAIWTCGPTRELREVDNAASSLLKEIG